MYTPIQNGQSGAVVRVNINGMFLELYSALPFPFKLPGTNANAQQNIPANTWIDEIIIYPTAGNPTIRIGISPGGSEIMPDTVINAIQPIEIKQYFAAATTLFFTFSGNAGTVNIRIENEQNYF